jgi:hypothetical protein
VPFWNCNPYQSLVDDLESALDYCRRGAHGTSDIPQAKGGTEIASPAFSASHLLDEALAAAVKWRDAFDYHAEGDRTDF